VFYNPTFFNTEEIENILHESPLRYKNEIKFSF
jgi:hypothetical protein